MTLFPSTFLTSSWMRPSLRKSVLPAFTTWGSREKVTETRVEVTHNFLTGEGEGVPGLQGYGLPGQAADPHLWAWEVSHDSESLFGSARGKPEVLDDLSVIFQCTVGKVEPRYAHAAMIISSMRGEGLGGRSDGADNLCFMRRQFHDHLLFTLFT